MKTSELINKLQQGLEELGDLEVKVLLDSTNKWYSEKESSKDIRGRLYCDDKKKTLFIRVWNTKRLIYWKTYILVYSSCYKMTKQELFKIIEKGLESCEYNYSVEDIWYKIIGVYLRETSNSKYDGKS